MSRAFIRHPAGIPIEIQADPQAGYRYQRLKNLSVGGLCSLSPISFPSGYRVTVRINFVKPAFEAVGRVVWCQQNAGGFDIGIQFMEPEDLFRARMVEQICYIEDYRKTVLTQEGRQLTSEQAAQEWIDKYAADFPAPDMSKMQ